MNVAITPQSAAVADLYSRQEEKEHSTNADSFGRHSHCIRMEHLNFRDQVCAQRRMKELEVVHHDYLSSNVEYREVLHDLMQAILFHKPDDPLAFIKTYFLKIK